MSVKNLNFTHNGLSGEIHIPGDKSISHRSIMFGSIAKGKTVVKNFLAGEDCLSTIACFRKLGVKIEHENQTVIIHGEGMDALKEPEEVLDVGNSGTTIRLIMGILSGRPFHSVLIGDSSIGKRPMTRVVGPLKEMGAKIEGRQSGEFTPLSVTGGELESITYTLPVASAQVKSAIILAGLQAKGTTKIIEPEKTRDHTERMIHAFSGKVSNDNGMISVEGGQSFKATNLIVPGDISSAAFFLAAGAIVPNSKIVLKNVGLNPTRTGIIDVLKEMGAKMTIEPYESNGHEEPAGDIFIETSELKGVTIDGEMIPRLIDEIPIIALLSTQATGKTIIKDAQELKVKETNRIDTVVNELKKLGANIEATDDGMIIEGQTSLSGGTVESCGDHRIGMMLSIASLISDGDIELHQPDAIAVSYPSFFDHIDHLLVK
ncbi:3-phosphoshikimate 1-carboxyvinyltransferase [Cytobacillus sp. FSL R7-0696]|uniref:3-phosphoshikimate 1-carboxyvinyltransferase n=1 Tax=Cytobacillus sp. FSL R7-0696 TaxID=2921691 RepID=UPI0030FB7D6C